MGALVLLVVLAGCAGQYDAFAKCLTENKVTMYGAYWCPHCAAQKEVFGSSFKHVTYVECSLPNKAGQTQFCKDQAIKSYPTWEFEGADRLTGKQSLQALSEKSGCAITE